MKKWLKILPVVLMLVAQTALTMHNHNTDDVVDFGQCVYCQIAAELSGFDAPSVLTLSQTTILKPHRNIPMPQILLYSCEHNNQNPRAPPQA